jgi:hypothetical protein
MDAAQFREVAEEIRKIHGTRSSNGSFDFGDEGTVLKCVKRLSWGSHRNGPENFGYYFGHQADEYVIGILTSWEDDGVGKVEMFNSLEELHQHWQLD